MLQYELLKDDEVSYPLALIALRLALSRGERRCNKEESWLAPCKYEKEDKLESDDTPELLSLVLVSKDDNEEDENFLGFSYFQSQPICSEGSNRQTFGNPPRSGELPSRLKRGLDKSTEGLGLTLWPGVADNGEKHFVPPAYETLSELSEFSRDNASTS